MPAGRELWLKPPGGSRPLPPDDPAGAGGSRAAGPRAGKLAAALSAGFFLACWVVYLLAWAGAVRLAGRLPLALYPLYSAASALGWGAGMVYVQLTRRLPRAERRRTFLLSFFAPPGLLFLLWAMAPAAAQEAAPLVPLYALGVFAILFAVPVSMRHIGRGPVGPGSR